MRILFIPAWHPTLNDPTAGVFIRKQAQAVAALGARTGLIYFQNLILDGFFREKMGFERCSISGVEELVHRGIWLLPKKNAWLLERWAALSDVLFERWAAENGKPDLIHAEGLHALFPAARLSKKHGVPFVFTEQSSAFRQKKAPKWLFPLLREGWASAAKVLAVSEPLRRSMLEIWPEGAIEVMPNLYSSADFPMPAFFKNEPSEQGPSLLAVGALEPKKGHDLLIEAFEIFEKKHGLGARLTIVGEGPSRSFIEKAIKKAAFLDRIELTGALFGSELRDRFLAADFFVLPSRHETFGVVAAEAMACGLPVLATACGGPETFIGPEQGIVVEPDRTQALVSGLESLLARRFDRRSIAAHSKANFSGEAIGSRLLKTYERAITGA